MLSLVLLLSAPSLRVRDNLLCSSLLYSEDACRTERRLGYDESGNAAEEAEDDASASCVSSLHSASTLRCRDQLLCSSLLCSEGANMSGEASGVHERPSSATDSVRPILCDFRTSSVPSTARNLTHQPHLSRLHPAQLSPAFPLAMLAKGS